MTKRTALLVLGMHRSGTSAATRIFNLLGADLPGNLMVPQPDNPAGFWESNDIMALHDRVFLSLRSTWHDPLPVEWDRISSHAVERFQDELLELLWRDFGESRLFIIKDPRICKLLPLWRNVLQRFDTEARFVLLLRNPLEVAKSLVRRNEFTMDKGLLLWLVHTLQAERETRNDKRSIISYEKLLRDWKSVVSTTAEKLSLEFPRSVEEVEEKVESFLCKEMRHFQYSTTDMAALDGIGAWVAPVYQQLYKASGTDRKKPDRNVLNRTYRQMLQQTEKLKPILAEQGAQIAELEARTNALSSALDKARNQLLSDNREKEELRAQLEREKQSAQEAATRHEQEIAGERQSLQETVTRYEGQLAQYEAQLEEERQSAKQVVAGYEAQLEAERQSAQRAAAGYEAQLEEERQSAKRAAAGYEAQLEEKRQGAIRLRASLRRPAPASRWGSVLMGLKHRPLRDVLRLVRDYKLLASSVLFDSRYYLEENPDVLEAGFDPVLHYLLYGAAENRSPGPDFAGARYLMANPDVEQAGVNPLLHFLRYGASEERRLRPSRRKDDENRESSGAQTEAEATEENISTSKDSDGSAEINEATNREAPRQTKAEPQLWHFIGDSIEWLKHHHHLTGVGKVSTELLLASFENGSEGAIPCVFDKGTSALVAASRLKGYKDLLSNIGAVSNKHLENQERWSQQVKDYSPEPGDHILFTGLVWTPTFTNLFRELADERIEFSVLVYDIIPIEFPEFVGQAAHESFSEWLATTVNTASAIFVSSHLNKDKILRWALLAGLEVKARICVIPFGIRYVEDACSLEELAVDPATSKVDLQGFVLSVGTIDKRKNQLFLCKLWVELAKRIGLDALPQLVLAGRDDLNLTGSASDFSGLITAGKLLVLEGLSDRHLAGLYKASMFTAFSSLSEGYGLPVAESLRYGKLCISSELPVVREHAGDLPWYFSTDDFPAALDLFTGAIQEPAERSAAEARIRSDFHVSKWTETYGLMADAARRTLCEPAMEVAEGANRPQFPGAGRVSLTEALRNAAQWCREDDPVVSIIIINWNASLLTRECIRQIWSHTDGCTYEVIIADNGSSTADLQRLRNPGSGVRLIEIGCNRYFGEANNIAAEEARGRYICLLNNDAFVQPGWLTALIKTLEEDRTVGVAGPRFVFPDGVIQEAGANVDAGGYPVRLGRGEEVLSPELLSPRFVDYVSAACLVVAREVYFQVGGFDLAYEPAYYEDVDLCLKIQVLDLKILYCPDVEVIHIEGHSANDDSTAEKRRKALGDINREKFVSRWGEYLRTREKGALTSLRQQIIGPQQSLIAPPAADMRPTLTAALYTPFRLTPGGGEFYLLSLAKVLTARYRVVLVTSRRYSNMRLENLGREFGINLAGIDLSTEQEFLKADSPDLMVTLGNHVIPSIKGRGKVNIYICQFPFPMDASAVPAKKSLLDSYGRIIVYSEYVRTHVYARLSAHRLPLKAITIIYPPVKLIGGDARKKQNIILSVGRFFTGGHSKRQDLLIRAFKQIVDRLDPGVELHLAGSSVPDPEQMDYLDRLMAAARGFPIRFHVNCSSELLEQLYRDAAVYWHGTGIDANLIANPETAEHFGISLVEAMSAEAVPFSLNSGGPREIITHGVTGFLYDTINELAEQTLDLFSPASRNRRETIGQAAGRRALEFSPEHFSKNINEIIADLN